MFHYWISLVLLFQLPTLSQGLACKTCSQTLQFSSAAVINPTDCVTSSNVYKMCRASLEINHRPDTVILNLEGVENASLPEDQSKTFVRNEIDIIIDDSVMWRTLHLYCASNDSCLSDINATYIKSMF